ncbi:hypothetical protein G6F24_014610 [Rhizopus arrhizus]|nr:hypothetical protein G6F24_014610 [Rhizopus arrhizus]
MGRATGHARWPVPAAGRSAGQRAAGHRHAITGHWLRYRRQPARVRGGATRGALHRLGHLRADAGAGPSACRRRRT